MREKPVTALAVLTPIDLESIPNVGHEALSLIMADDRSIRRSNRGALAAAAAGGLFLAVSQALPLSFFGAVLWALGVIGVTGGPGVLGWNFLRRIRFNMNKRMIERDLDRDAAVMEGGLRVIAQKWNESYEAVLASLEEIDEDTPLKTLRQIARSIDALTKMRLFIDQRIAALHRRQALPAPPDPAVP